MPATDGVSLDMLAAWATARSLSRGLPPAVIDGEAVRVDTGTPAEERRYIFAKPTSMITSLAATVGRPGILIKLCAPLPDLTALLPPGWRAQPQAFFMAYDGLMSPATVQLAAGYALTVAAEGAVLAAEVTTADGFVAARGRAVRHAGLFVYDQIMTAPEHRRRGLAGHVMRGLEIAGCDTTCRQLLTATAAGHALYMTLRWSTRSLYSTAEFAR